MRLYMRREWVGGLGHVCVCIRVWRINNISIVLTMTLRFAHHSIWALNVVYIIKIVHLCIYMFVSRTDGRHTDIFK